MAAASLATKPPAMLATWRESYFERLGCAYSGRARAFTDAVLPITIAPSPTKLERVLVGAAKC